MLPSVTNLSTSAQLRAVCVCVQGAPRAVWSFAAEYTQRGSQTNGSEDTTLLIKRKSSMKVNSKLYVANGSSPTCHMCVSASKEIDLI